MPARVTERKDGTAEAYYAEHPAWHGLGVVTEQALSSQAAIRMAQLDWEVVQRPLQAIPAGIDGSLEHPSAEPIDVPHYVANVRQDNLEVLGVVTDKYTVVQNREAFAFTDELARDGAIKYESAGSLFGGRVVWLLARLPWTIKADGDDITQTFALFMNGHDGGTAIRIVPTAVRVVCWNTLRLALGDNAGVKILHRGDMASKIREGFQAIGLLQKAVESYQDKVNVLQRSFAAGGRVRGYFEVLCPDPTGDNVSDQVLSRRDRDRTAMMTYYDSPRARPQQGTMWGAFNAATAWSDHARSYRGKTDRVVNERKLVSIVEGVGDVFKQNALNTAMNVATGAIVL